MTPQPPAGPTGLPRGPGSGRPGVAGLDLGDLLLVLILSLGGARLLGVLIGAGLGTPSSLPDQEAPSVAPAMIALFSLQSLLFITAIYLVAIKGRALTWADLGLRRTTAPWGRRAVVAAIAAFPPVGVVNLTLAGMIGAVPENPQLRVVAPTAASWESAVGMLLVLGVIAPIAEELLFRGLLYPWLRARIGLQAAMLISALVFSFLHGILWLVPAITVLGLILAWVYEKSGSLWAPIVTHGLFNTINASLVFLAVRSGALTG